MRNYLGLRIASSVMRVVGLFLTVGSVVSFIPFGLSLLRNMPEGGGYAVFMFGFIAVSLLQILFAGLSLWAMGEAPLAVIDIARSTARLKEVVANTALTVSFFEHITAAGDRRGASR